MDFRRHVALGSQNARDLSLSVGRKSEIAEFEQSFVGNQNVLQFNVHVSVSSLIVEAAYGAHELEVH